MKNEPVGMVVYKRGTDRRGVVTKADHVKSTLTVKWDSGRSSTCFVTELMSERLYNDERLKKMSMKKEDCKVGAVVYLVGTDAPLAKGKIVGPVNDKNLVIVEWDGGHLEKKDISKLLNEQAGIAENQRLLDEKDRLEREFANVEEECKKKMEQAADLIREAARLATSKGKDLQDMYQATYLLEQAMDDAGWSTSSWHC